MAQDLTETAATRELDTVTAALKAAGVDTTALDISLAPTSEVVILLGEIAIVIGPDGGEFDEGGCYAATRYDEDNNPQQTYSEGTDLADVAAQVARWL